MRVSQHINNNEKGSTLIAAFITLTLVGYMGASLLQIGGTGDDAATNGFQTTQAMHVGNGGLQYALQKVTNGESPDVTGKVFGQGTFDVTSSPTNQTLVVTGYAGKAKKTQTVTTNFAQQCVTQDVTPATYDGKNLNGIELTKSCNDSAIVTSLAVEWNFGACAQSLSCTATANPAPGDDPNTGKQTICHIPPGNPANQHTISVSQTAVNAHLAHGDTVSACGVGDADTAIVCEGYDNQMTACGAATLDATVNKIKVDGTVVATGLSAMSGSVIDIQDVTLTGNKAFLIDEIEFDQAIPDNSWFAVTANFSDGSTIRKPFKFGSPAQTEGDGAAFTINNGEVTVNPGKTLTLDVLGSALTCGNGGAVIPVTLQIATNNSYNKLFNGDALSGGESYSTITASGDTYRFKANGTLKSCDKFDQTYESNNVVQVKMLTNGNAAPLLAGFGGQKPVQSFLAPYLNADGEAQIDDNQFLMLFEIGVDGNAGAASTDFQDLVLLLTIS